MEKNSAYGVIYKVTSPSGRHYIGQTTRFKERMDFYKWNGAKEQPKLFNAIKKYGWLNMKVQILTECFSKSEIDECEIYFIGVYRGVQEGYNCKEGGANGKPSQETRIKMSKAGRGRIFSKEHKAKISVAHKGRTVSKETREKLRQANLGKKCSEESKRKGILARSGYKHSEEVKKRISESHSKNGYKGKDHHGCDKTMRRFSKIDNSEIFEGTFYEFKTKYGFKHSSAKAIISRGKGLGWKLLPYPDAPTCQ